MMSVISGHGAWKDNWGLHNGCMFDNSSDTSAAKTYLTDWHFSAFQLSQKYNLLDAFLTILSV